MQYGFMCLHTIQTYQVSSIIVFGVLYFFLLETWRQSCTFGGTVFQICRRDL